ncbi:proteoglycan-like protein [Tasmannia lanceolata]|uniref:proteoglycan-like protein n=1 Tax=Tasmannia lanceolata TaxID=3420 RepID=UPI004063E935
MGGCATKPKDSNPESLPEEDRASQKQIPTTVEGDTLAETKADGGEKEEPLLDLSEPKTDAPLDSTAESKTGITDLVSEIGGLNVDSSQGLTKDPADSKKAEEVEGVESGFTEQTKENVGAENEAKEKTDIVPETGGTVAKNEETEIAAQRSDVGGNGELSNSDGLVKNEVATSVLSV